MAVMRNETLARLRRGELATSFNISKLRSVETPQIAKACGFHWIFIDLEHSAMDLDQASQISMAALPTGITSIVRVPLGDRNLAARVLDGGAQGVIFPHVDSAEEARALVQACRFPPVGTRSMTYGGPQLEYEALPPKTTMPLLDAETMIVVMVETPEAVENVAAMAAVEGVDGILVGGQDLSATMGIPGEVGHPDFVAALERVIAAARGAGKFAGLGGVYQEDLMARYVQMGVRFLFGGADMSFMMAAARKRSAFLNGLPLD